MPETLKSLNRLFSRHQNLRKIVVTLDRSTITCALHRTGDIDPSNPEIVRTTKRSDDIFTSNAIDAAVYKLRNPTPTPGVNPSRFVPAKRTISRTYIDLNTGYTRRINCLTHSQIIAARMALNMSQEQFAQLLGTVASTIRRWERGNNVPIPAFESKIRQAVIDAGVYVDGITDVADATENEALDSSGSQTLQTAP